MYCRKYRSLNFIKYWIFFLKFCWTLYKKNKDPGGQLIMDPQDPDPQHWQRLLLVLYFGYSLEKKEFSSGKKTFLSFHFHHI